MGAGKIARDFACSTLAVEGAQVVAVASRRQTPQTEDFAEKFGCVCHLNYQELVADAAVEAVYVATIHPTHFALAKLSLEAGKHVLVEKPFGMNAREAKELAQLAASKGLFLMEAMWTACLPATLEAIRMVSDGEIGELLSAAANVGGVWYVPEDLQDEEARQQAKSLGSGVLLDVGCYAMAVPYMFFRHLGVADDDVCMISSVGSLCAAGCDIAGVHTLSYGQAGQSTRTAIAHCSWNYTLPNEVVLYGTRGILVRPIRSPCACLLQG